MVPSASWGCLLSEGLQGKAEQPQSQEYRYMTLIIMLLGTAQA